jgi:hypothetical protein
MLSVADPGCLSRIPDPDFYPSRIPDLDPEYYVIFEMLKKKNLGQFLKNCLSFYPKNVQYARRYMGLGSRGQKGTGSRIRIRNTAYARQCHPHFFLPG